MVRAAWFKPVVALIIGVVAGAVSFAGLSAGVFGGFQRSLQDKLFPSSARDGRIVVVAIDDRSLATLGRWPWPRSLHAQLLDAIEAGKPGAVAYDVQFSEPSADAAGDAVFGAAVASGGNVALAATGSLRAGPHDVPNLGSLAAPIDAIAHGARGVGLSNVAEDPDGVVRSIPMVAWSSDGTIAESLALATLRVSANDTAPPTIRPGGVDAAGRLIPTSAGHAMTLNFATQPFPTYSAGDVIGGKVPASAFDGKIVFIGATAPGLGDRLLSPVDKSGGTPGVEMHAEALNTMLTATYLTPISDPANAVFAGCLALLVALAVLYLPVIVGALAAVGASVAYTLVAFGRLDAGHPLNLVYPYLWILLAFLAAIAVKYFAETRLRRQVATLFGQYVPRQVADDLTEGDVRAALEGRRLEVTVLFCDLRGFTPFTASLPPATVKDALNIYYRHMSALVLEHGGTLLQYVGDEVYACWGAPVPRDDHAVAALACAKAFHAENPAITAELAAMDAPPLQYGIGLNSGPVVAAHVGNELRRQYGLVGDTVNVGARLCSQAKAGEIVLSEHVLELLGDKPELENMGVVDLKGVNRDINIYRVPAFKVQATE